MQNRQLVFLCGARDYHAMDWYKSAVALSKKYEVAILTDLFAGEGYKKIVTENDKIYKLIIIDKFLFKAQSRLSNLWRNIVKLVFLPLQVYKLRHFHKENSQSMYHAHSMYYLWLAWAAKVPFVGTPQGSDILVKPFKSKFYKYLTIKSLKAAKAVTVDSKRMKDVILLISGVQAHIVQNGIDLESLLPLVNSKKTENCPRQLILSNRGMTELYRIKEILLGRNLSEVNRNFPISFIYPFGDNEYKTKIEHLFIPTDVDLKRVDRLTMYELFLSSKLVISIPYSDSSPRSVYEAIFCGAAVAITYHPYYDILPECMKKRIILVDIENQLWLDKAIAEAETILKKPFEPSDEALELFDQKKSFKQIEKLLMTEYE
jgi:hypothetical protein